MNALIPVVKPIASSIGITNLHKSVSYLLHTVIVDSLYEVI